MPQPQNINIQEENDVKKIADLLFRNYKLFILSTTILFGIAFFVNRYSIPTFRVSSSILIKANSNQQIGSGDKNDFLYSNLFGRNQNFQNELWIMKSYPVIEKTVRNLDLSVIYFSKGKFNFYETYKSAPFIVSYLPTHPQPLDVKFTISFLNEGYFNITAESKEVNFYNFETRTITHKKNKWTFTRNGKLGELIETSDLAFIIESRDTTNKIDIEMPYGFKFSTIGSLSSGIKGNLEFTLVDKQATVINISLLTESSGKGVDFLNELMDVYSEQNLEQKNHLAIITIDYIEKQLNEISDSLNLTEDNLQRFRSSNQLLNISDQVTGISAQYLDLQNQLAELVSRKRYFDYVSDLLKNDNFSNLMLPASIGISDQLLNNLMTELLTAQAQRSNLIENKQERNPLVQKLGIQIENLKKTISENISAFSITTSISMDEMNKRIRRTEVEINRLPATQRQLGNIERKFRLNDAIYNYLMEKHAEAKITKASNLPDDIIIEPAKMAGGAPVKPNKKLNFVFAFIFGLAIPFGYILLINELNNKIESQDDLERLTDRPVLGKILHNKYKTQNVMFEFPKSNIAESIRALRTNLNFYVRGGQKKVILVTSCFENEGKSFISLNLAMSYAQLGRRTILVDFDLRKPKSYFKEGEETTEGLSSYMIDKANLEDIIIKSPHEKLDYVLSGILPPNPTELLALDKTEKLLAKLKIDYDIIVMDTTPLAQVTDAYVLIDHSEVRIIITRHGQTLKKVFSLIMKDLKQKNVTDTCIVLNDNRRYQDQYGYGYGYYNKKRFFKTKVKKKVAKG
jgi:capsular exopolysaccharide synthesis family protein